ncbi:DUF2076 family protein [Xylophilus sp. GW821-FHT01B05]
MTPQEHQLLSDFLGRLAAVDKTAKDPEADALIYQRLAPLPDAPYLLVQRTLLLEQALEAAQRQIAQLQQNPPHADAGSPSFLSPGAAPGFGRAPSQAYTPPPSSYPPEAAVPAAPPAPASWRDRLFGAPPAAAAPAAAPSFLGQAASTAAGVAGGMFLFNGLENLLGRHGNSSSSGLLGDSNANMFGGALLPQETVVQNITTNDSFFLDDDGSNGRDERREADGDASDLPDDDSDDFI